MFPFLLCFSVNRFFRNRDVVKMLSPVPDKRSSPIDLSIWQYLPLKLNSMKMARKFHIQLPGYIWGPRQPNFSLVLRKLYAGFFLSTDP